MEEYCIYNVDLGVGEGHEQGYSRLAIVFKTVKELRMCVVIPLTSNFDHLKLPYTTQVNKAGLTNLGDNSVALVFQIRAIAEARIIGRQMGKLEEYQISKIKIIIKDMLAL